MSIHCWVASSSGGRFPIQLATISEACEILKKPDICLSTSGGNLAIFMTLAGNFTANGIWRICNYINSSLFSGSWWPKYLNFLSSTIIGIVKGSLYKSGKGGVDLMNHIFTQHNITRMEIWTGTTESESGKGQLFCNLDQKDSILSKAFFDHRLKNYLPHKYLSGNIEMIAKASTASASIPIFIPATQIGGKNFSDGGTSGYSPLTPLADSLDYIAENKKLHITYFSSFDVESECDSKQHVNIVQNTDKTIERILKMLAITDRLSGINLVKKLSNTHQIQYFEGKCDTEILKLINKNLEYSQRSFFELYRKDKIELDITNFKPIDIHEILKDTRKNYYFRLWLATSQTNKEHINNIYERFTYC